MVDFPPSFSVVERTIPHSVQPDSLPPSSLFALVSTPPGFGSTTGSPPEFTSSASPVVVFIHGYPQNHTLWQPVLEWLDRETDLVTRFRIIVPDLPGYGNSRKPVSPDGSHEANCKREIGKDLLSLVDAVFPPAAEPGAQPAPVILIGHDRGARVAYRLAKDSPQRIVGLCVQDIVPTTEQFKRMTYENRRHATTIGMYHWVFLATPAPLGEMLLLSSPSTGPWYARYSISAWTGPAFRSSSEKVSTPYGEVASPNYPKALMDSWCEQYTEPDVVRGALEDYRAGATIDLEHDEADAKVDGGEGVRVKCPLLALWCEGLERAGAPGENVQRTWEARGPVGDGSKTRAKRVDKQGAGHFLPIEACEEVGREINDWINKFFV